MLGKLLKHDFKAVNKPLLLIHLGLCLMAILTFVTFQFTNERTFVYPLLTGILIIFCFGIIFATNLVHIIRFYRNLYTDEGYLTHTLPVKPWQLFLSKGIVYFVWVLLDYITIAVILFAEYGNVSKIPEVISRISAFYGCSPFMLFILLFLFVFSSTIFMITLFYFCICIGSLFAPHKIIASIIAYFVVYAIQQLIGLIFLAFSPVFRNMLTIEKTTTSANVTSNLASTGFLNLFYYSIGLSIVLGAIFVISSLWIMNNKLNLE